MNEVKRIGEQGNLAKAKETAINGRKYLTAAIGAAE
ncbi:hypothetical protein FHS18_006317 [Paenibacillus phyllosphaerae]|uniref:Uncharacterized protein n=1 Tax=Paenibacillus phyllosphaerae TaxID=274593 RepID=A0A7W5B4D6_9BACL|nr:hypothetical protein [Paenibacillus phyllosphaerae]